ncbi:MAG: PAS domain-containing sensor histidine kinase [Mariniphaga sp.]
MSDNGKTKEELQIELAELQAAYNELKRSRGIGKDFKTRSISEFDNNEPQLKDALDALIEGFMIIGFDWTYVFVNKSAAHQAFQEPENLIGRRYADMYPGIEDTEIFAMYLRCMRERISLKFETSYTFTNKSVKWFLIILEPVTEGMMVLSLDISERKRAEEELRQKEERYRLLAENARDVVWTMKLDGTLTYMSPAIEELSGFTVEESMEQSIEILLTPESQLIVADYLQKVNSAFESGLPLPKFHGENVCYRKGGSTWFAEVFVFPLPDSNSKSVTMLGVTRDITDRKQFEAKLLEQTYNLKELNTIKDKFFSIIAHDLKTPFNGILGFSEILKEDARNLDIDSIISYADIINSTAKQAFNLLENLLEWAILQQNGILFEPRRIFINPLIENEIKGLQYNADKKNITLQNNTTEEIIIAADEKMVCSMFRNLISNAIKFTNKGGEINVEAKMKVDHFEVSISDTGVGIGKEEIGKLFRNETSFTSKGTENEKGTGLGLILCKEFAEIHGGTITVESEIGKGSTFTISIPAFDNLHQK